jgi:hypothetical protein
MKRWQLAFGITAATAGLAAAGRDARACGGCFHPPTQTVSDITDERMLLAVSTLQSTLYDQIQYSGNPTSFAWVLPIKGTVDVGLSADVLFDSIDELTATQIIPPEPNCPPSPCPVFYAPAAGNVASSGSTATTSPPAVTVTKQENVGPYETVQLHSTDSSALSAWLAQNGFVIPADVTPVIAEYVKEGFDFLAMKLLPNQGVQAMRPVRITMPGSSLSLPLRMAAVGTGVTVGITIWVVSDGRYEPQNFPFFHIDDSQLVWDFSTNSSNYTTLRAQNETALKGKGWEIESSITLNQQLISSTILSGGQYYAGAGVGFALPVSDPSTDYLPVGDPDAGLDGGYQSAEDVRAADVAALFAGLQGPNARITRVRSDIAHAAMTSDLLFQASADQSELSNSRTVTQSINLVCPTYTCGAAGGGAGSGNAAGGTAPVTSGSSAGSGSVGSSNEVDASVGTAIPSATATVSRGSGASCTASAPSKGGLSAAFGSLVAMIGLLAFRRTRSRGTRRDRS